MKIYNKIIYGEENNMQRKIRAFCGNEGSGKDYSCTRLIETMGFQKVAFADPLRDIAFQVIGIPFEKGMKHYRKLKQTPLINDLTFRNMLENLGAAVRKYDEDFWAKAALKVIKDSPKNICLSDLRYYNEYAILKKFADENDIDFKLTFCDYHSEFYKEDNPHQSAALAAYLKKLGYKDQQYVKDIDMQSYAAIEKLPVQPK